MHPRVVFNALAAVCAAGAAMFLPASYSFVVGDGNTLSFGLPALLTLILGAALFLLT